VSRFAQALNWSRSWRFVDRRYVQIGADVHLWPINRPFVRVWRDGDGEGRGLLLVSFQYGNGNSDPVFSLDVTLTDPRPVAPTGENQPHGHKDVTT
jgi:hypothetical protein